MGEDFLPKLMRGRLGKVVARPWFDRLAGLIMQRKLLSMWRQWAAANAAGEDLNVFEEEVGAGALTFGKAEIASLLPEIAAARRRRQAAEARWEDCFFGRGALAPGIMATIETERIEAAQAHNLLFKRFSRLRYRRAVPAAAWDVPSPAEAGEMLGGPAGLDPSAVFRMPKDVPVLASPWLDDAGGRQCWISFRSPSTIMDDFVTAWVYTPRGIINPPTLVFGHGLSMDFDHWKGLKAAALPYVRAGIRVIWPEAPWHGRRTPRDRYPGEALVARGAFSAIAGLTAATQEWAVLLRWARRTSSGPVAVGGISLGALTAQMVAAKARYWPEEIWPDALFLITHCASLWHVFEGVLPDIFRGRDILDETGWTFESASPLLVLTDPWEEVTVSPGLIVALNGSHDRVTPYGSALRLLDHWEVPGHNRFTWRRGHFSVPLGLLREPEPIDRFNLLLNDLATTFRSR